MTGPAAGRFTQTGRSCSADAADRPIDTLLARRAESERHSRTAAR